MNQNAFRRDAFRRSSGMSLLEVLFLLFLLAVVASLILLRVSRSRESSRRIECESNLRSLFVALESYQLLHGQYPIGTQNPTGPIRSQRQGYHHNWIEGLLPQMEQQALYDSIDFQWGVYDAKNSHVGMTAIELLMCPAAKGNLFPHNSAYAGVTSSVEKPIDEDGDGILILNQAFRPSDVTDGLGYVAILGEKLDNRGGTLDVSLGLSWNSGTRASLRTMGHRLTDSRANARPLASNPSIEQPNPLWVGGFSSNHFGGGYLLMASGEFRFYGEQTDLRVLRQLGGRADGDSVP